MYERYNIPQQKRCSSVNIFFWLLCILCILCICSAILFLSSSSTPSPTLQKKEEEKTNTKKIISIFRECLPNITHWVLVDEKSGIFYYCSESSVWEYILQVYTSVDSMPLN